MDRFKMVVTEKLSFSDHTVVRLVMADTDEVPAIMFWHYDLPLDKVDDRIGDTFEVTIRPDEGPL